MPDTTPPQPADLQAAATRYLDAGDAARAAVRERCLPGLLHAVERCTTALNSGHKLLFFGNGGSASDAQHLAAEFVVRFVRNRRALPAIALTTDTSILTAAGNDFGFEQVFARQIEALGQPGDVAFAISTSGNSENVLAGQREAKQRGLFTVALSGRDGGALAAEADLALVVPAEATAPIQECHITLGHLLCELVEQSLGLHTD